MNTKLVRSVFLILLTLILVSLNSGTASASITPGSLAAPSPNSWGALNPTHWKVEGGTTIQGTILNATDLPAGTTSVNVYIKSSTFGNTTLTGTVSGSTITFWYSVPFSGCFTTNVAYGSLGNVTNNALLPKGKGNAAAGFAIVDSTGNVVTQCGRSQSPPP